MSLLTERKSNLWLDLRHGLVVAASAARRASSFAFGPGEILSVTQMSDGVIFATAR